MMSTPAPSSRARSRAQAKKTAAERILEDIAAGKADGDLNAIAEAIGNRVMAGAVASRWKIELDGMTVTEDDITLDEAALVQEAAGIVWRNLDPLRSAVHARALILVCLQTRKGLTEDEAKGRTATLGALETIEAISHVLDAETPTTPQT
jgi:hypothetical protein